MRCLDCARLSMCRREQGLDVSNMLESDDIVNQLIHGFYRLSIFISFIIYRAMSNQTFQIQIKEKTKSKSNMFKMTPRFTPATHARQQHFVFTSSSWILCLSIRPPRSATSPLILSTSAPSSSLVLTSTCFC